jgi:hypothetical protein
MHEGKLIATFRGLCKRDIHFIIVGDLAATLHGATGQTYDVSLVYSLEPANIERLLSSLQEIETVFRIQPERRLQPTASHLAAGGHLNLLTSLGPLDLLGSIGQGLGYSDLLPLSDEMAIGEGVSVRVLNLETLISVKEQLGSEKDFAVLPILRQTLRELKKKDRV